MAAAPTRERIRAFVAAHPGSSARGIQRSVGLGWGETAYHLRRLTASGELARERGGRRDYFFPKGMPDGERRILIAFQTPVERAILLVLARESPLSFAEVVERLGQPRSTIAFHLRWLLSGHLVERVPEGAGRRYRSVDWFQVRQLGQRFPPPGDLRWSDRFSDLWAALLRE